MYLKYSENVMFLLTPRLITFSFPCWFQTLSTHVSRNSFLVSYANTIQYSYLSSFSTTFMRTLHRKKHFKLYLSKLCSMSYLFPGFCLPHIFVAAIASQTFRCIRGFLKNGAIVLMVNLVLVEIW